MTAVAHSAVLVLEDGIDPTPIEQALPPGARVTKATLPDAAYLWASLTKAAAEADLVVFACSHEHERTLEGIASLSRQLAKRPPLVVLHTGSSNGFMQRAFSAGADDLITLPQPTQELAFSLEKAIARRRGAAAPMGEGAMITVLGPKGGNGQDAHRLQPHGRTRPVRVFRRDHRPRSAVRRRRPRSRLATQPHDLRPGDRRQLARRGEDRRLPHRARLGRARTARAGPSGPGGRDHDPVPPNGVRDAAFAARRGDRRHPAGLHAGGDRGDRQLVGHLPRGACSTRCR